MRERDKLLKKKRQSLRVYKRFPERERERGRLVLWTVKLFVLQQWFFFLFELTILPFVYVFFRVKNLGTSRDSRLI